MKILMVIQGVFVLLIHFAQAQTAIAEDIPGTQQEGDADLAQELSNPVADPITIPIQMNYDYDIGPSDDGWKLQTKIQPAVPINLNDNWNLITRTIMPVIYQDDIFPGSGSSGCLCPARILTTSEPFHSNWREKPCVS